MAELKYRTIGQGNPRGKQKVFFISHPDDFERYFDEISKMILKFQENVAIWYTEACSEVNLDDLDGMQLFVMPVTAKFLYKSNDAREVVFAYSQEKHIPVLPMMMEDGLENEFNRICGNLQMISLNQKDSTELPYEEKIKKFLENVLVGDKLAEKVRAAFDAYIFLSYRKMDRKYAQELMRLIHKNPVCRDIAIWYDEFLTPGENFDAEIGAALDKSQVFALVITPNLVNSQYIVNTEYPNAVEKNKRIIPTEMAKTDIAELEKVFPGLPNVIDGKNENALNESLLWTLKDIAKPGNDENPEHNFFIGLAYLNGIDVEVDTDRAAALITSAAEAKLPEACKKLCKMYQTGDGVERDYYRAIEWEEKYIALLEESYQKSNSNTNLQSLFFETCTLVDDVFELKQLDRDKKYAERMLALANEMSERDTGGQIGISISYEKLGRICMIERKLEEAEAYFEKSLAIRKKIEEDTPSLQSRRSLTDSYIWLGDVCQTQGKLADAKAFFEEGHRLREGLNEELTTVLSRRDLAISYERLGLVCMAQQLFEEAELYIEKSYNIMKALAEENYTLRARSDLAYSYLQLGDMCRARKETDKAKVYYEQALKLRYELAGETGTVEARRDLSMVYNRLGDISQAQGNLEEAKAYFEKDMEISEALARETNNIRAYRDFFVTYERLGDVSKAQGNISEAKKYYNMASIGYITISLLSSKSPQSKADCDRITNKSISCNPNM